MRRALLALRDLDSSATRQPCHACPRLSSLPSELVAEHQNGHPVRGISRDAIVHLQFEPKPRLVWRRVNTYSAGRETLETSGWAPDARSDAYIGSVLLEGYGPCRLETAHEAGTFRGPKGKGLDNDPLNVLPLKRELRSHDKQA